MRRYWLNRLAMVALCCGMGACTSFNAVPGKIAAESDTAPGQPLYQDKLQVPAHLAQAEQQQLQALEANADDLDALVKLGVLYRHMESFSAAEQVLARAEMVSGGAAQVLNEIAITQRASGAFETARDTYQKILDAEPDYHDAHFNLGILYDLYLGDAELAHKHYSAYLDATPDADERVERWLADLRRRFDIDPETSMVNVNE